MLLAPTSANQPQPDYSRPVRTPLREGAAHSHSGFAFFFGLGDGGGLPYVLT